MGIKDTVAQQTTRARRALNPVVEKAKPIVQKAKPVAAKAGRAARTLPEKSLHLVKDGYLFQERLRADAGESPQSRCPMRFHMLGKPATLIRGREAVEVFYDTSKIKRAGAMPKPIQGSLFGEGAVHTLDDAEHLRRKMQFVELAYDDAQVARFAALLETEQRAIVEQWRDREGNVFDDSVLAYGRAVFRWAGIEGSNDELDPWIKRLSDIVEGFGKVGPAMALAWINRARCDRWFAELIEEVRSGARVAQAGTALAGWAAFTDVDGQRLDAKTAGIEVQNTTRPLIAVARFASFAAKELLEHRPMRDRIAAEVAASGRLVGNPFAEAFATEVRRTAPFVPMLPAFARVAIEHDGARINAGERVLLDVYGTLHDPVEWERPEEFDPERFMGRHYEDMPAFIAQGGGDVHTGHRCPGEKLATVALGATVSALTTPGVELNARDVEVNLTQMPTKPGNGVGVRIS